MWRPKKFEKNCVAASPIKFFKMSVEPQKYTTVQLANSRFAPQLQRLIATCFPTNDTPLPAEPQPDQFLDSLTGFHDAATCLWLLLVTADRVVGFVTLAPYATSVYVANLCVDPTYQKRGLGRRLLELAQVEVFSTWGQLELCGSVEAARTDLYALYTHLGAEVVPDVTSLGSSNNTVRARSTRFRFRFTVEAVRALQVLPNDCCIETQNDRG